MNTILYIIAGIIGGILIITSWGLFIMAHYEMKRYMKLYNELIHEYEKIYEELKMYG